MGASRQGLYHSNGCYRKSKVAGGCYPPLRLAYAKRFLSGNEPGGSGNQCIGTSPVRYCPAALPPGRILSDPTGAVETMRLQQPTEYTPSASLRSAAFNRGMIATGNHNFERFAALCNTPEVEPRVLRTVFRRGKIIGIYHPADGLSHRSSGLYYTQNPGGGQVPRLGVHLNFI